MIHSGKPSRMSKDPISTHTLLMIGIVSVMTGAIYAGNWQAQLLERTQCLTLACAQAPQGCRYEPPYALDANGCQMNCGNLVCNDRNDSGNEIDRCATMLCPANSRCESGQCIPMEDCSPYVCEDGSRHPRCSEDGHVINYFVDPCFKPAPAYCEYNGRQYEPGTAFPADDGCNTCRCDTNGQVACTLMGCLPTDSSPVCTDAAGMTHAPGESFIGPDGCNTCICGPNGEMACTKKLCPALPSQPLPPIGEREACYGTTDCPDGLVCSVEFGDCNSSCPPGTDFCPDVCTGFCMQEELSNPVRMQQCTVSDQCPRGMVCTAEFTKECFEDCPLSDEICSDICGGKCIPVNPADLPMAEPGMMIPTRPGIPEFEDEVRTAEVENRFTDIDADTLEGSAANALASRGIIGGFADGTFRGKQPVNRAEAAKFLLMARFGEVHDARNNNRFLDVLEGEWYVKYVVNAADLGIISGYSDGMFRPANTVNTAELLKMLSITFGLLQDLPYEYDDVPNTAWFARYAGAAQRYDLFPGRPDGQLMPERLLTRGEVAIAIHTLLRNQ